MHVCQGKLLLIGVLIYLFLFFQAKVNEDASGDVNALQRQIQQLKVWTSRSLFLPQCSKTVKLKCLSLKQGQLSSLLKHHNFPNSQTSFVPSFEDLKMGDYSRKNEYSGEKMADCKIENIHKNKVTFYGHFINLLHKSDMKIL